jgi:LacI family transcriptional regulator
MTRYLLELGHRRFALISAPTAGNDRSRERGAGVRAARAAAGLALRDECVGYGPIALDSGTAAMRALHACRPRPTAVIATNDVFAVGAMLACREAGVAIPDDVSITGVDNTDRGATQTPGLTSFRTPIVEIGRAAALQLFARLEGRTTPLQQQLAFELVKRGSTAPPRRASARRARLN